MERADVYTKERVLSGLFHSMLITYYADKVGRWFKDVAEVGKVQVALFMPSFSAVPASGEGDICVALWAGRMLMMILPLLASFPGASF